MGGKALGVDVVRIDSEELEEIGNHLIEIFSKRNIVVCPVKPCIDKHDHGDVDVVVCIDQCNRVRFNECLRVNFSNTTRNGPITSVGYQGRNGLVQVDFIEVPTHDDLILASHLLSRGDANQIIGMMMRRLDFKYTHTGLAYYREGKRYELSKNFYKDILPFCGIDPCAYHSAWTMDKIFEVIVQSSLFDATVYNPEKLGNAKRQRTIKRKYYNDWLQWLSDNGHDITSLPAYDIEVFRNAMFKKAIKLFPHLLDELSADIETERLRYECATILNGNIVSDWTGFKQKRLGDMMKVLKQHNVINNAELLFSSTEEEIKNTVLSYVHLVCYNSDIN